MIFPRSRGRMRSRNRARIPRHRSGAAVTAVHRVVSTPQTHSSEPVPVRVLYLGRGLAKATKWGPEEVAETEFELTEFVLRASVTRLRARTV